MNSQLSKDHYPRKFSPRLSIRRSILPGSFKRLVRLLPATMVSVVFASVANAAPTEILFVGNSFTNGRYDPVRTYNAANVHDLNCLTAATCAAAEKTTQVNPPSIATGTSLAETGPYGGIPGIFKKFADEAGLNYNVSLDTVSSATLNGTFSTTAKKAEIGDAKWDQVVLQEQSFTPLPAVNLLGNATRGNFANFQNGVNTLTGVIAAADQQANRSNAQIYLYQTQPLASYTYTSTNPNAVQFGSSTPFPPGSLNSPYVNSTNTSQIEWVASDLHNANKAVAAQNSKVTAVALAGDAWISAIHLGIAQRNPYLVNEPPGQIDLWDSNSDNACCTTPIGYHPSSFGAYLSALVLFETITGIDPRTLGAEFDPSNPLYLMSASQALGISSTIAGQLGVAAALTVAAGGPLAVPEPSMLMLLGWGIPVMVAVRSLRRRVASKEKKGHVLLGTGVS